MKHFLGFVLALVVCASSAQAGEWEFLRYERSARYTNQDIAVRGGYDYNGGTVNSYILTEKHTNRYLIRWDGQQEQTIVNGQQARGSEADIQGVRLWWNDGRPTFKGPGMRGTQVASSSGEMSITPIFRWKRNQIWNGYVPLNDPNDNPPAELFYAEKATISGNESIGQWDGNGLPYSPQNPFGGKQFTFKHIYHPFGAARQSTTPSASGYGASHSFSTASGDQHVTRIASNGQDEVRGETRYFSGQIDINARYAEETPYDRHGSATLGFGYSATPVRFSLDVSANEFERRKDEPRDKQISAYAAPGILGRENPAAATTPFWGGTANYSTSISPSLLGALGTPKFEWNYPYTTYHSQQHKNGLDPTLWDENYVIDPRQLVVPSTPDKQLDHDLGKLSENGYTRTQVKVKVTGDNPQKSTLTAKATIDWYRQPYTRYRAEIVTEVIDYTTNTPKTLEEVMNAPANPHTTDEERVWEAFTVEYEAMKKEFITTGATYIGLALEGEMMVGSWFVPDEVDLATGGLTLAGKPIRKLFKVIKGTKAAVELATKINRVRDKLSAAVPAVKAALGHDNFRIVMKRKKFREARLGHVGPDGKRVEAQMGELKDEEEIICDIPGGSCFVAGTKVPGKDGNFVIEELKKGDLVWSRSESTGEVKLKRVVQTFERYSATLVLTFNNGEKIETTEEHPFYVAGKGFVPAGEMGIGTSIVTRAGPAVQLVSSVPGQVQKVFNFEVEDFHTYFVGSSEAWVHNTYPGTVATKIANNSHTFTKHRSDWTARGITTREQLAQFLQNIMDSGYSKVVGNKTAYWQANSLDDPTNGCVLWDDAKNIYDGGSCYPMTKAKFDSL